MTFSTLQELAADLCAAATLDPMQLRHDHNGRTAFSLAMDSVEFAFTHQTVPAEDDLVIHACFGVVPPETELQVLRGLMARNFERTDLRAPCFSRNPDDGNIVLRYTCALEDMTGLALWRDLNELARVVLEWRDEIAPGAVMNAMPLHQGSGVHF